MTTMEADKLSFWEHFDELRATILRIIAVVLVFGIIAFLFKEELFTIVLAPKSSDFLTYRIFNRISAWSGGSSNTFSVQLINTGLAQQFIIHMKTALCAGLICASPYALYQLFRFVSPALYENERRYATRVVGGAYLMFGIGLLIAYFLIFPFTFRFLGTYQVSGEIENLISLNSYISTLMTMSLAVGLVFEIPVIACLFARFGLLRADYMRHYRKHAIVLMLVLSAIITPTSDVFTLSLVALPMCLLYEFSILLVARIGKRQNSNR